MNWGHGLAITMLAFVVFILTFVYKSTQQDFSLVTKNYYKEALEHDAIQIKRSNYITLNETLDLNLDPTSKVLSATLPSFFISKNIEGTVFLYNPTDDKKDKVFEFKNIAISIPLKDLSPGLWKVKVDWTAEGKSYLFEKSQFIN